MANLEEKLSKISPSSQLVSVVLLDNNGNETARRKIPRHNMTKDYLKKIFNVGFLFDKNGIVLYPKEWPYECILNPQEYNWFSIISSFFIGRKVGIDVVDDKEDIDYIGDTACMIENVNSEIKETEILYWLQELFLTVRDDFNELFTMLCNIKADLQNTELEYGNMTVNQIGTKGKEDANSSTKQKIKKLKNQYDEIVKKLDVIREMNLNNIQFDIKLIETIDGVSKYFLQIDPIYDEMLLKLLNKPDLSQTHLLKQTQGNNGGGGGGNNNVTYKTFTGDIPIDMNGTEIDMKYIRIVRRKHGQGVYYYVNTNDIYTGQWNEGYAEGYGEIDTVVGSYKGKMKHGHRYGKGYDQLSNGDRIDSIYGLRNHLEKEYDSMNNPIFSLIESEEFVDGLPQNESTIKFADGSSYEGNLVDSMINGKGKYVNALKEVYEGEFEDGFLNGKGKMIDMDGNEYSGYFEYDSLTNDCVIKYSNGDKYIGLMEYNMKSGYGKYIYNDIKDVCVDNNNSYKKKDKSDKEKDKKKKEKEKEKEDNIGEDNDNDNSDEDDEYKCYYRGQYINNKRHGRGVLKYKVNVDGVDKMFIYEGSWSNGLPTYGTYTDLLHPHIMSVIPNDILPEMPIEYINEQNGETIGDKLQKYEAYRDRLRNIVTRNTIQYNRVREKTIQDIIRLRKPRKGIKQQMSNAVAK